VTLTGAGGCGKTRLAIQTAISVLTKYPAGAWIVELAPLTVPEHIDQAIAEIFNIKEQPGIVFRNIITYNFIIDTIIRNMNSSPIVIITSIIFHQNM